MEMEMNKSWDDSEKTNMIYDIINKNRNQGKVADLTSLLLVISYLLLLLHEEKIDSTM